jgi:hypothetical protein
MTLIDDGAGRRFVADQNGIVYQILGDGSLTIFLDLRAMTGFLANQQQIGLQSIAFHPDYHIAGSLGEGLFYTSSSWTVDSGEADYPVPTDAPTNHHSVVHEWRVSGDPDQIDPLSAREVLRIAQPYRDHNLQQLGFNPNHGANHPAHGLLFIGVGDGGNVRSPRPSVDPYFVAQSLASPLGTILRIDPIAPAGGSDSYSIPADNPYATDGDADTLGEIWCHGLRNPHRFSWDRGGAENLFISDIGQSNIEEINVGFAQANYGWSEREGTFLVEHFNEADVFELPANDESFGYLYPMIQYDHDEGDRAITGGYVARSGSIPELEGRYVFGDLVSGRIFHADAALLGGSAPVPFESLRLVDAADGLEKSLLEIVGNGSVASRADLRFGWANGEIYLVTKRDGAIRRLIALPQAVPSGSGLAVIGLVIALALVRLLNRRAKNPAETAFSRAI